MPKPVRTGQRYLPGLDGLRALAVLAVVAYHLNLGWAQGGLLGVGVFFTLSGYLITDLLLGQYDRTGRLQLGDFWLRRARRLLPALFVMLTVVVAWVTLLDRSQLPAIRGAVVASVGYVSNWWLIAQHSSYFARFSPPSPLGHLWSLAVEEQFYLIWPWLLLARAALVRAPRAGTAPGPGWPAATLLLAAASAVAMAVFYQPGYDPTRVYDGTDTRAFGLLIGAALAFVWPSCRLRSDVADGARRILDGTGIAGLAIIFVLIWRTSEYSAFLYHGGMVLLSVATALVVGAAASPASRVGVALGCAAAALDRRPVLRHLPVALPDHRADDPGRRPGDPARAARCRWRRASPSPRCPGGSSRNRSATAPSAAAWRTRPRPGTSCERPGSRPGSRWPAAVAVCGLATAGLTGIVQPRLGGAGRGLPAAGRGEHAVPVPVGHPRPRRRPRRRRPRAAALRPGQGPGHQAGPRSRPPASGGPPAPPAGRSCTSATPPRTA